MVSHYSSSDSNSPSVSWALLRILAVFYTAVVWMVSTRPPNSKSSSPFNNPLITVPKTPITIGIIITFIFHSFSNSQAKLRFLSFFSYSFSFIPCSVGKTKSSTLQIISFFFLLIIIRSGLLPKIRGSVYMSKSHWSLCVSFSRRNIALCIYHLFVWSNLNFLQHLPMEHLVHPVVSSQILLVW